MPFYIYAWISLFATAFTVVITKFTSKHSIKNPWLFNFVLTLITLLFTSPVALINHAGIPSDWPPVIAAGVFFGLFYLFYIFANYKLDASAITPLFNFKTIFTVLLGSLFLQEKLSSSQSLFFLLIVGAGMFSNIDEKMKLSSFFKPGIGIALLGMMSLALNSVFIKLAMVKNDLPTVTLWIMIVNMVVILPTFLFFKKDLKSLKASQIYPVLVLCIFQVIYNFTANIAYGVNIGITSIIISLPLSMVVIFVLSIFKPNLLEKHTLKVYAIRFASAAIMIWGALQLSR